MHKLKVLDWDCLGSGEGSSEGGIPKKPTGTAQKLFQGVYVARKLYASSKVSLLYISCRFFSK
jgi:hypothetical protein